MASYDPATSFYPCPWNASDIFKPQPVPPPTYYLKDHVRIVYNDSDWPTTPEDEGISEEQDKPTFKPTAAAGNVCNKPAMISVQPLSLLTAKRREYTQREKLGSGGSDRECILEAGQFASPGGCSVLLFLGILLILSIEQSTSTAEADIPTEVPLLKSNEVVAHPHMSSPAPHAILGATNANAMQKPASKQSGRIQIVLNHTMEDKENLPLISSDSDDDLDHSLQEGEDTKGREMQPFTCNYVPNPFLDSDEEFEEFEDLANGRWRANMEVRAEEEPYSDQESPSFEYLSSYPPLPMIWPKLDSHPALTPPSSPEKVTSRGRTDQTKILSTTLQVPMISGAKFNSNLGTSV